MKKGSETWERVETRDPKPTARTQLSAVTLASVPLSLLSPAIATHDTISATDSGNNSGNDDTRRRIRSLVRPLSGYHLVDDVSRATSATSATPWVVSKMSSYSLLSTSDDSLAVEEDVDSVGDHLPCMIRTASGTSRHLDRMRVSESVQNFGAPAVRWGVPRSMTTMRFNPFDAASKASSVKRDETTSDYASEIDVESSTCSVIGINNPNYEEFANLNPQIFLSGSFLCLYLPLCVWVCVCFPILDSIVV